MADPGQQNKDTQSSGPTRHRVPRAATSVTGDAGTGNKLRDSTGGAAPGDRGPLPRTRHCDHGPP